MNHQLYTRVSAFIDYENDLLDRNAYQEWLTLWQDTGMYIVPIQADSDDYANQLNYAYDDAAMRRMRVARLSSGESISVETSGGTIRLTSRLRVVESDDDSLVKAHCALLINENRRGQIKQFVANVEYDLVPEGEGFTIAQKVVKILNAENYLRSISYLL